MSKTRKIKILSDGERYGADIVDAETGETLRNVLKASIVLEGPEPPKVTLEVLAPAMDITATADVVQSNWLAALFQQLREARAIIEELDREHPLDAPKAAARAWLEKYPQDEEASDGE